MRCRAPLHSHPLHSLALAQRNRPLSRFPYRPANFLKRAPSLVLLISTNGITICAGCSLFAPRSLFPTLSVLLWAWEAGLCRQVPGLACSDFWLDSSEEKHRQENEGWEERGVRYLFPAELLSNSGPIAPCPQLQVFWPSSGISGIFFFLVAFRPRGGNSSHCYKSILYCSVLISPPTPLCRVPSSISLQVNLWRGCLLHSGPLIHPPSFFKSSLKSELCEALSPPAPPSSYRPSTSWDCPSSSPCSPWCLPGPGLAWFWSPA